MCRERGYPFLRLDGTTSISKRQKLVNRFNDPSKDEFAFLLSSKAGGCGLNLIGGNRLVLFDPDWNPANDKQAAARVWRDGQKKRVYIYRFLSTGTIEEKVYQRQMSKEGLQKVIQQEQSESEGNLLSTEDLRDLFTFHENVRSEIHEKMNCNRCQNYEMQVDASPSSQSDEEDIGGFASVSGCLHKLKSSEKQVGMPKEEDLANWGHHLFPQSIPDTILQSSAGDEISFVFTNQVSGKLVPLETTERSNTEEAGPKNQLNSKENIFHKSTLASQNQAPFPLPSTNVVQYRSRLSNPFKHLLKPQTNLVRPSEGVKLVALKHKISPGNQLPQKRIFTDDKIDDDFD